MARLSPLTESSGPASGRGRRPRRCAPLLVAIVLAGGAAAPVCAQSGVVAGRVLDRTTLQPLAGAQVVVVGAGRGGVTDGEGRFRIEGLSSEEVELEVVMLGYTTRTASARVGETDVRIVVDPSAVSLEQVVVTGTPGGRQRRALGHSVTTIRAADVVATQAVGNVQELLNGRAPGVTFTSATGRIGGGGVLNIRGVSTISLSHQPLLYIDGVRVANDVATGPRVQGGAIASRLSDVNPEDVESVEIIKGPAAATLYGTEAANGVIQIITKRGRFGQRPQLTATIRQGVSWFMDPQGRIPTNYARDASGQILAWNGVRQEDQRGTPIWENGSTRKYSLSLAGGGESIRYHLGATYDDDRGIQSDNKARRFAGHATVTVVPGEELDVETSLSLVKGKTWLGGDYGLGSIWAAMYGSPLLAETPYRGFNGAPPEVLREVFENTQALNRFTASMQLTHRPVGWLSHRLRLGLDQTGEDSQALTKHMTDEQAALLGASIAKGSINQDVRNIAYITADYSATARAALTSAIGSATSAGLQYYRRRTDITQITARDFPLPGIRTAAGAATRDGTQDYESNTTIGLYGQQEFDLNGRLFISGAVRVDNNSAFGEAFELATYPKVSASWLISEEPFWPFDFVDQLRLRGAFGASGQQPIAFAALQTYAPSTGPDDRPIATPQFPGNPQLKPERGEELELGFDAQLLDRVHVEFTYFTKQTKDAILERPTAPSGGFPNAQFVNIGRISNHGIELGASARLLTGERLSWEVAANIGTANDRIEDMGGLPSVIFPALPFQRHQAGFPIAAYFTRRVVSATFDPETNTTTDVLCDDGSGGSVSCDEAPPVFFGTTTPTYTGSVSNTFTIAGRLRLNALIDFRGGNKLFDTDSWARCVVFTLCDLNMNPQDYDPRVIATVERAGTLEFVDALIHDASFAKLREVSASYTLPERWVGSFGVAAATLSVAARNLHTWTSYPGLDPERRAGFTADNNQLVAFDQAVMPPLAQLVATLSITF